MANPSVTRTGLPFTLQFPRAPYRFQGGHRVIRSPPRLTEGRQSVVVSHAGAHEYTFEIRSLNLVTADESMGQPLQNMALFRERYFDWYSWAQQGNLFAFALDDDKRAQTTLTAEANISSRILTVADSSGFSVGDNIRLVDPLDSRRNDVHQVFSVDAGGPNELELLRATTDTWAIGAIVLHRFYFPSCLLLSQGPADLLREAGSGPWRSDVLFRFTEANAP